MSDETDDLRLPRARPGWVILLVVGSVVVGSLLIGISWTLLVAGPQIDPSYRHPCGIVQRRAVEAAVSHSVSVEERAGDSGWMCWYRYPRAQIRVWLWPGARCDGPIRSIGAAGQRGIPGLGYDSATSADSTAASRHDPSDLSSYSAERRLIVRAGPNCLYLVSHHRDDMSDQSLSLVTRLAQEAMGQATAARIAQ